MATDKPARVAHSTARWQDIDRLHHLHPFTHTRQLHETGVVVIERGEGAYVWDSEGRRLLDAMAGLWCVNVGYGRKELAAAAAEQLERLAYYNLFLGTTTPPAIELAERLAGLAPGNLNRVFFSSSGSEANDTIVKMARYYWHLQGKPQKQKLISRRFSYHGSTLGAASLSHIPGMHEAFGLPFPGFEHAPAPYWYKDGGDEDFERFCERSADALEEHIVRTGPETEAALFAEPVQGAGGLLVPTRRYWEKVQEICRRHEVLLVADEVITGFGRTGEWFGSQLFGIEPDFMTVAKGLSSGYLPISAAIVSDPIADLFIERGDYFKHGYTYSGHPATAAVALANLDIIEREGLVSRVREDIGPYLQQRLSRLADHPLVGDVRGIGLLAGLELVADKAARRSFPPETGLGMLVHRLALEHGLIVRAVRDIIVLSPPFILTREQVDACAEILQICLDLAAERVQRA